MAERPLRRATRRSLGRPLPHQLADKSRAHPTAQRHFLERSCDPSRVSGINPGFPGLSRSVGQVTHVLLTRSPLRHTSGLPLRYASLDLHALGTPPAFILSQDQTLQHTFTTLIRGWTPILSMKGLQFGSRTVRALALFDCSRDFVAFVRGQRVTIRMLHLPPLRGKWALLAFGTLFSCQGAHGSASDTSCVRRVDDDTADPDTDEHPAQPKSSTGGGWSDSDV